MIKLVILLCVLLALAVGFIFSVWVGTCIDESDTFTPKEALKMFFKNLKL